MNHQCHQQNYHQGTVFAIFVHRPVTNIVILKEENIDLKRCAQRKILPMLNVEMFVAKTECLEKSSFIA